LANINIKIMFGEICMKNAKKFIIDYLFIIFGSFLIAFATNYFLIPQKISAGGLGGIGTVLLYVFDIPISVTVFLLNIVLFLMGYKILNKSSLTKTIAGIFFLSVFLELTSVFGVYSDDILISSVFGGLLVGIGVGFTVSKEASTGGSDFAALMLHRIFPHISLARIILIIDFFVIVIAGIIFKNYTVSFYSLISLYISSKIADAILVRGDYAKSVYIISDCSEKISEFIINEMNRGVTGIYSRGYYKNKDSIMLMCIVRSKEIPRLLNNIKLIDNEAFLIVSEVREVRGAGFKKI